MDHRGEPQGTEREESIVEMQRHGDPPGSLALGEAESDGCDVDVTDVLPLEGVVWAVRNSQTPQVLDVLKEDSLASGEPGPHYLRVSAVASDE
jgi:hypothetical protein